MKVAVVHDWITGMRGGERVLEALFELFPEASLHTLIYVPGSVSDVIESREIRTSFLQSVPGAASRYRYLLPSFPLAVGSMELPNVDLVLSSSHCVAKGVRIPPGARHLCYCHTPMRYVWDQYDAYFGPGRASIPVRAAMQLVAPALRAWDVRSSRSVDAFVANSTFVGDRIRLLYGRDASVVHPPVDLARFAPGPKEDFYLVLGAQAPYKRVDLAVEAARRLGRSLLVVGEGVGAGASGTVRIEAGDRVTLSGRLTDEEVADVLRRARALVLPGVEDFGISVVEALASGTPVVALGTGGVRDSVTEETGEFFVEPTVDALVEALLRFEARTFEPARLVASARPFGRDRFLEGMRREVDRVMSGASRPAHRA